MMERCSRPEASPTRARAALPAASAAHRRRRSSAGALQPGDSLPPEREMAALTGLSRVTVRKAVQALVAGGAAGAAARLGHLRRAAVERLEQALSLLTSFTEDMARRGKAVRSVWLARAVHAPSPEEMMALGLAARRPGGAAGAGAAGRRRAAGDRAGVAVDGGAARPGGGRRPRSTPCSQTRGLRPVRAVQRISAANLGPRGCGAAGRAAGRGGPADRADLLSALGAGGGIHPLALSRRRL